MNTQINSKLIVAGVVAFCLLLVILWAVLPARGEPARLADAGTLTPALASPSSTPSPIATAPLPKTLTPTTGPTRTPRPTSTSTATLSPAEIAMLTELQENADDEAALKTAFPMCNGFFYPIVYSPDRNWIMFVCGDQTTIINRKDMSKFWTYTYPDQDEYGGRIGYYRVKQWPVDGRYLYLSLFYENLDGACLNYAEGLGLARVDLETGQLTTLLDFDDDFSFYSYGISNQDQYLAFSPTWYVDDVFLAIQDLKTGHRRFVDIYGDYTAIGNIIWSPDNKRVVFSAMKREDVDEFGPPDYDCHQDFSVIMLDRSTMRQTILVDRAKEKYFPREWRSANTIKLSTRYGEAHYILVPDTGLVYPPLPTATPAPTLTPKP